MTTKANNPGMPKNPETDDVTKLIGTCRLNEVPNAFKKNNNSAPIIIFIKPCPIKRIGFIGAPTNKRITIIPPKTDKIMVGSISTPPSYVHAFFYTSI